MWNVYVEDCLKSGTRRKCRKGIRTRVLSTTRIPHKSQWKDFLRVDESKQELLDFLSEILSENIGQRKDRELFAAKKELVLCSHRMIDTGNLSPCTHEEVDARVILHAKVVSDNGYKLLVDHR